MDKKEGFHPFSSQKLTTKQWKVFALTAVTIGMFAGLIGGFAMIKDQLEKQFKMKSGFLGIADGLSFIGRIVGGLYIVKFPSSTPKRSFVISSCFTSLFLCLIPFATFVPAYSKPLILFSMFASGICRSHIISMFLIFSENINSEKHKKLYNLWSSLLYLGQPFVVFISYYLLNDMQVNWQKTFLIIVGMFTLITLFVHIFIQEVNMEFKQGKQTGKDSQAQGQIQNKSQRDFIQQNQESQSSISRQRESKSKDIKQNYQYSITPQVAESQMKKMVKIYFKGHPENIWFCIDSAFERALGFNIMMWAPYYFSHLGFHLSIPFISSLYYVMYIPSTIFYQKMLQVFASQQFQKKFTILLLLLSFIISCLLPVIEPTQQSSIMYISVICLIGITQAGPSSRIFGSQVIKTTKEDVKLKQFVLSFFRLVQMVVVFFFMVTIGFVIQKWAQSFFYVIIFSSLGCLSCYTIRKYRFDRQENKQMAKLTQRI